MPKSSSAMPSDDTNSGFSQAISQEKNERIARTSLNDIMVFQKSLEEEMARLTEEEARGDVIDTEFFNKIVLTKNEYQKLLASFTAMDTDGHQGHSALIAYADTVQDIISHLHCKHTHEELVKEGTASWRVATTLAHTPVVLAALENGIKKAGWLQKLGKDTPHTPLAL